MQGTNTTESYSYDPVGNRLSSLGVSSYTNNTSNELTSTSGASYANVRLQHAFWSRICTTAGT